MTFLKIKKKTFGKKLSLSPISWGLFLLEFIGKFSFKIIFIALKFTFPITVQIIKYPIKIASRIFQKRQVITYKQFKPKIKISKKKLPNFTPLVSLLKSAKAEIKFWFWHKKSRKKIKRKKISNVINKTFSTLWQRLEITKIAFFSLSIIGIIIFAFYLMVLKDLPNPNKLVTRHQAVSTKIFDRNGKLLFTIFNGFQNRTLAKLNQIPKHVVDATISIEDREFYRHQGFSLRGIARAIERNVFNNSVEGGSTITQQLVKNALLSPEKTLSRKIKELVLSMEVELLFSKDEILQMYFNEIPYGGTSYGIQAAAKTFFNKNVDELTLGEAAMLAGLPAAPTSYSPFGANPQNAFDRQKEVLKRMVEDGYITSQQAQATAAEKITFAAQTTDIKAPHFIMFVKDLLVQKYGQREVEEGGLSVVTSLDLDIQNMAQKEVSDEIDKLYNFHVTNGAAVVTNPRTGEILAMVGSRDYFDIKSEGNVNVTTSLRQPGSSIKVVNYAYALQHGYSPSSIIPDTPIAYSIPGSPVYAPVNYDGKFHGNVTLRTALGSSYNVPAVKVLASFGVDKMVWEGTQMGITTWTHPENYGLSLTLGAAEVKMTDMAVVYGTLANMGKKVTINPILKVTDTNGNVLETLECANLAQTPCPSEQVLPENVAYLMTDVLSDNNARAPAFGPNSLLVIPNHQVAVKTGTTNDKRDNWTVGYTQDYVVTVWVGNNDNSPMSAVASGITGASPIWHNIMNNLLKDQKPYRFPKVSGLLEIQVCAINGLLPCDGCPTKTDYFVPGTEPKFHCDPQMIKKIIEDNQKSPAPSASP